jgi:hypothetical protein
LKSSQFFSLLIAYLIIFVGLGLVADHFLGNFSEEILLPFRFFYWSFNGITFLHLALLISYYKMKDENKKSSWIFFLCINQFLLSLVAIAVYALAFFKGNKQDGLIAVLIALPLFVFFIAVLMKTAKE